MSATQTLQLPRITPGLTSPLAGQMGCLQPRSPGLALDPQVLQAQREFVTQVAKQIGLTTVQNPPNPKEYSLTFDSYMDFIGKTRAMEQHILTVQPLSLGQSSISHEEKQLYVNKLIEQAKPPYTMKFTSQQDYQLKKEIWTQFLTLKEGRVGDEEQVFAVYSQSKQPEGGCCTLM